MTTLGLCLEPLDVLFFRDSRPFNAGMRGVGGLPLPQTLTGALRTHLWRQLGVDFEALAAHLERTASMEEDLTPEVATLLPPEQAWALTCKVRGPWLCSTTATGVPQPLVAAPADLARLGKKSDDGPIVRLYPTRNPPPGWQAPAPGMVPFWYRGAEVIERLQGYLTLDGLQRYLNGEELQEGDGVQKGDHRKAPALYTWEDRVGIAVDPDRNRAADQYLYAVRLLRLQKGIAFYAEIDIDEQAAVDARALFAGTLAFGGEGRQVRVTVLSQPVNWPRASQTGDGLLAVLITPGIFGVSEEGNPGDALWKPDTSPGTLIAAAVPGARPLSGWDLARRRPKPTRQAVMEGSVYCFRDPVLDDLQSPFVHLNSGYLDATGYGLALQGVWSYA